MLSTNCLLCSGDQDATRNHNLNPVHTSLLLAINLGTSLRSCVSLPPPPPAPGQCIIEAIEHVLWFAPLDISNDFNEARPCAW